MDEQEKQETPESVQSREAMESEIAKAQMLRDAESKQKQATPVATKPYVIARTYSAGVFAGHLVSRNGMEAELTQARRIWYWDGAASLSQLAMEGTKKPHNCKFPCAVNRVLLTQVIEILEVTAAAQQSIESVPVWEQ